MERQQRISQSSALVAALVLLLGSAGLLAGRAWAAPQYTKQFALDECSWSSTGRNQFFSIRPGDWLLLEGEDDGEDVRVQIKVLNQTKKITFTDDEGESLTVYARVVEEREWKDGKLVEVSRNYYARCVQTNDIYYFGEDVDIYENGKVVSNDGAWLSGVNGAKFALMMPGKPTVGDRFYLEMAPGAVERVEIASVDATIETPAQSFSNVVHAMEYDELDGGTSQKWYAPGIGMVGDDDMRAVKVELPTDSPGRQTGSPGTGSR
jgi:hypothetical protein